MGGRLTTALFFIALVTNSIWAQIDLEAKLFIKPEKPQRGDSLTYRYVIKNLGTEDVPKRQVLGTFVMKRDGRRVYGQGIKLPQPLTPGSVLEVPWQTVHERHGGVYVGGKYSLILEVATYKDEKNNENNKEVIEFDIEPEDRSGTDLEAKLFIRPEKPQRGDLLTYRYVIKNIGTTVIPKKPVLGTFLAKRDGRRVYGQGIKLAKPLAPGEKIEQEWKTIREELGGKFIGGDYSLALEVSTFTGETNIDNNKEVMTFHIEAEDRSGTDLEAKLFIKPENPQRDDLLTYRYEITNTGSTIIPKKPVLGTFLAKRDGRRVYGQGIKLAKPLAPGETIEQEWKTVSEELGGKFIGGDYTFTLEVSTFPGEANTENNKEVVTVHIEPEDRTGTDIEAKLFIKPEKPQRGDLLTYRYEIKNLGTTVIPKKPVLGTFLAKRDGRRVYGQGIKLAKPLAPGETIEQEWKTVREDLGGKFIGGDYTLTLEVSAHPGEADRENNKEVITLHIEPEDRTGTDIEAKLFIKPENPKEGDLLTYRYEITNIGKTVIPKKQVLGTFVANRDGRRFYSQGIKMNNPLAQGEKLEIPWKTVSERLGGKFERGTYELKLEVSSFKGETNLENNKQSITVQIGEN